MSRNWICCAEQGGLNHREMQTQRRIMKEDVRSSHCLLDSVANLFFEKTIYREAPAEIAAGLCPAGWPMAAVPTLVVVIPWGVFETDSGTETCSWTDWRSLLSSGWSWR